MKLNSILPKDFLDYFLLSALAGSLLMDNLYPELREEAKMLRLKEDLQNKSPLVKIDAFAKMALANQLKLHPELREEVAMLRLKRDLINKSRYPQKLFSNQLEPKIKVRKIYNKVLLDQRGGELTPNDKIYLAELVYKFVLKFQEVVLKLLATLKNKELLAQASKAFAKQVFYRQLRKTIQLLLDLYNIRINYKLSNGIGPELIATAIFTGGATGIVSAWLPVLRNVLGPPVLVSAYLVKKLIQNASPSLFESEKDSLSQLLKDEDIDKQLQNLIMRSQEEFSNSNKVRLRDLNWNRNPEIREAAQRLNIFKTRPELRDKFNLDPSNLDRNLKGLFHELGIAEKIPSVRTKGKIVYFRDVIRSTKVEEVLELLNDFEVVEAEKVLESIRIKND